MNQILSVENTKKEKKRKNPSGPIEIQKIVRIFAIIMIIFGMAIIGSGSYSMYKGKTEPKSATRPVIVASQTAGTQVTIQIKQIIGFTWLYSIVTSNLSNKLEENSGISTLFTIRACVTFAILGLINSFFLFSMK